LPTTALIVVLLTIVKEVAGMPPKLTVVVPLKLLPCMLTVDPVPVLVGLKLVMDGGGK
jgi:hypothetical protein